MTSVNEQAQPQAITIDGVAYLVKDLTPQIRGTLSLMDTAKARVQNCQVELAFAQAAYNEFGVQLREGLKNIKSLTPPKVVTPRKSTRQVKTSAKKK